MDPIEIAAMIIILSILITVGIITAVILRITNHDDYKQTRAIKKLQERK